MPKRLIHVLLADDNESILEAVRSLLETEADLKVVGCASDGSDAVLLAMQLRLDIAILDISMPGIDGIEAARRIRKVAPATRIIMLSAHVTEGHVIAALQAGARGYVDKLMLGQDLISAVRAVAAGRRYLSASLESAGT